MNKSFLFINLMLIYTMLAGQQTKSLDQALSDPETTKVVKMSCSEKGRINEIKELQNLKVLYLSNCTYKKLPKSVLEASNLTLLNVQNNQLKALPKSIAQLEQLAVINLRDNDLRDLQPQVQRKLPLHQMS